MVDEAKDSHVTPSKSESKEKDVRSSRSSGVMDGGRYADEREKIDELLQVDLGAVNKPDVSASTLVKMMGVASATELKLVEGKIDLIAGRLNSLTLRLERIMTQLSNIPTASDVERLESQISLVRSMLKDMAAQKRSKDGDEKGTKEKLQAYIQQSKTASEAIRMNSAALNAPTTSETGGEGSEKDHTASSGDISNDEPEAVDRVSPDPEK